MLPKYHESLASGADLSEVEADTSWSEPDVQSGAWSCFYQRHGTSPFFKARRYLTTEFPVLASKGITVLEVGCGTGASALPVLSHNPESRVIACDFAASAVASIKRAVQSAGALLIDLELL